MKSPLNKLLLLGTISLFIFSCSVKEGQKPAQTFQKSSVQIPHLEKKGTATQLIVDDKPYIILGGELGNSSFTSLEYMAPAWTNLKAMNLNTILAPFYWELIEPAEGKFDFSLYDQLIQEARKNDFRIVILWFGSWKNSMSSHAPSWVKKNQQRFPRVKDDKDKSQEILTPFSEENLKADMKAYQALMQHLKETDINHTVIMIQTENEIGMLPTAKDHSTLANQKFVENVPPEFIEYLKKNKEDLVPEFKEKWAAKGFKESGNWEEIFGKSVSTDEIFMAWYYAKFTDQIVKAGKDIYPLPMYVNAALNRPGRKPGEGYPSAGPLPHIMDVWIAAGPSIDFLAPDIYFPNIEYWCDLYTRRHNPLFIPEAGSDPSAAAKALFTIGHYESIGYSPFSIESKQNAAEDDLGKAYKLVSLLSPIISSHIGKKEIDGVLLEDPKQERKLIFGKYEFTVRHSYTLGYEPLSKEKVWVAGGAIIVQTGADEFYIAGSGVVITFKNLKEPEKIVGILKTDEGRFDNDQWKVIRHLNGDQIHQGRHVRIFKNEFSILRFELYNYN